MRLLEFQAKNIFARHGIAVPQSALVTRQEQPDVPTPVVLKAQVTTGGRGKAGAIRIVRDPEAMKTAFDQLWSMEVKGLRTGAVLAEELVEIQKELYLAVLIDKKAKLPVIVACAEGGVDIEETARTHPEKIIKKHIDPCLSLPDYVVRYIGRGLDYSDTAALRSLLQKMLTIYREEDATLVEINPLAVTPQGLVALDAKVVLDDKAAFRHADTYNRLQLEQDQLVQSFRSPVECLAAERGITFVSLGGEVGLISDGAGTGMLTIDLIHDLGGKPANFCELGGLGNAERMRQAMEVILSEPKVKSLLITLIGGLTRMDEMAEGIADYMNNHAAGVPVFIRMCGTQEEAGKAILAAVGMKAYDDLMQAAADAVSAARDGAL